MTTEDRQEPSGAREVGGIDRFGNWHNLDDLSADTGGKWWWLCSCEQAEGGYHYEHAAHRGWGEHLAVALAEEIHG